MSAVRSDRASSTLTVSDDISAIKPYFENNKNRAGGFEYPFYAAAVDADREQGYEVPPHWHYHLELLFFAQGAADVLIGNRSIRAQEGELLLIPPCGVHAVSVPTGMTSRHYVIGLDPALLTPMPSLFTIVKYVLPYSNSEGLRFTPADLSVCGLSGFNVLAEQLLSEYERQEPAFELAVTSIIYRIMTGLVRHVPDFGYTAERLLSADTERDRKRFRETLAYIDERSHEPLTASEMARRSLMSYSHFAACFRRLMHTSFTTYLQFVRVRKAEQLLLDPEYSITQIAMETGFNHSSYFIKHFRRIRGVTPRQYRQAILNLK